MSDAYVHGSGISVALDGSRQGAVSAIQARGIGVFEVMSGSAWTHAGTGNRRAFSDVGGGDETWRMMRATSPGVHARLGMAMAWRAASWRFQTRGRQVAWRSTISSLTPPLKDLNHSTWADARLGSSDSGHLALLPPGPSASCCGLADQQSQPASQLLLEPATSPRARTPERGSISACSKFECL